MYHVHALDTGIMIYRFNKIQINSSQSVWDINKLIIKFILEKTR